MRYEVIHVLERNKYIKQLEALSNKGFRVISAGMTPNPAVKCFEWWAILQRDEGTAQEPKRDEAAGLLEALRKVKEFCGKNACTDCPFGEENGCYCELCSSAPEYWRLNGREVDV